MKRVVVIAAAMIGSGLFMAIPSMAQPQVEFGIGQDGRPEVGVRDPQRERYERREYWRQRRDEERAQAYEEGRRDRWRERQRYGAYGVRIRRRPRNLRSWRGKLPEWRLTTTRSTRRSWPCCG